jgi:hypothetical protein
LKDAEMEKRVIMIIKCLLSTIKLFLIYMNF